MAFPTTALLDDFNRGNGAPGANWTGPTWGDPNFVAISGNRLTSAGAGYGSGAWVTAYGPDFEFYCKHYGLSSRRYMEAIDDYSDTSPNGFGLRVEGALEVRLERYDNGATTLLQTWSVSLSEGDQVGMSRVGTTFTIYVNGTPQSPTVTDANYGGALYGNFEIPNNSTPFVDDFGGGTIGVAITASVVQQSDKLRKVQRVIY